MTVEEKNVELPQTAFPDVTGSDYGKAQRQTSAQT